MTTKQFDPNWPFPQFNEEGVQLFAPDYDKPSPAAPTGWQLVDDMEEALL